MSNREQLSKSIIPSQSCSIMQHLLGTAELSAEESAQRDHGMKGVLDFRMEGLLENIMVDTTFHETFLPRLQDGGLADIWLLNLLLNGATMEELLDPTSHFHARAAGKLCFEFNLEKEGASLEMSIARKATQLLLFLPPTIGRNQELDGIFEDYCLPNQLHPLPNGRVSKARSLWKAGTYVRVINPSIQDYHLNDSQRDGLSAKLDLINEQFNLGFITAMVAEIRQPSFAISFRHFFSTITLFDLGHTLD
jgi:hypothetical protein